MLELHKGDVSIVLLSTVRNRPMQVKVINVNCSMVFLCLETCEWVGVQLFEKDGPWSDIAEKECVLRYGTHTALECEINGIGDLQFLLRLLIWEFNDLNYMIIVCYWGS